MTNTSDAGHNIQFSVDELDRDERYISLFSGNAMTRVSNLETIFTEGQLANDERRGIFF